MAILHYTHLLFDWLFLLGSFFMTIYGFWISWKIVLLGLAIFFFYPLVLEIWLLIWGKLTYSEAYELREFQQKILKMADYSGIIYSPKYNITLCGLEKNHPFDAIKYQRIIFYLEKEHKYSFTYAKNSKSSNDNQRLIWHPDTPTRGVLQQHISFYYLLLLNYSIKICSIIELPLYFLPSSALRSVILSPMLRAVQGTMDAVSMALAHGYAINLSGGYHHAYSLGGSGFCVYADIGMAIRLLQKYWKLKKYPNSTTDNSSSKESKFNSKNTSKSRVLYVDLDAHMGNGVARDFKDDPNVFTIDFFNNSIYPNDETAREAIDVEVHIKSGHGDAQYHKLMKKYIPKAIQDFKPDFIVYNAGTDCMSGDPLGNLNLSHSGIVRRDELMFRWALINKIPIMMVLSGGY